ncbi:hypothetical protein Cni_G11347 [Canna indica]|uniref:Uncharacterized protein n=1 Tax=Canna indica TaxID=4628 RepID=A0AAQ3K5W8_9LILI|nr:hypothetical protein Cni_G11347 [Canna indica]
MGDMMTTRMQVIKLLFCSPSYPFVASFFLSFFFFSSSSSISNLTEASQSYFRGKEASCAISTLSNPPILQLYRGLVLLWPGLLPSESPSEEASMDLVKERERSA